MAMRIFNADETIFTSNGLKSLQPIYCHEIRNESEWYLDVRVPLSFLEYTIQDNIIVVETLDKGEQAFRIRNITVGQDIKFEAWHIGYDSRVFTVSLSTFVNLNPTQALTQLLTDTQTNNFTVFSDIATQLSFSIIDVPLYDALIDMAERYNAVLEFDNWQIRLVSSIGSDKGVTVAYGKNLESSSFEENWDMVVTELSPKGNNGLVGTTLYSSIVYDRPYAKIVSFDTDDLTTLNNLASAYLSRFEKPRVNYKVKASNLSYLENVTGHNALSYFSHLFLENYDHNELSDFKYPTLVGLGDTIKVVAKQFELFTDVLSYKFNTITRKMIELEFGNYRPTIRNAIGQLRAEVVEQSRNITQLKIDEVNGEISAIVSDVNGLEGQVSSNTAQLSIQAGQIATKVEQSTFNTLSGRVDTAESSITQQAGQIALKADQTTVNAVSAVANSKARTFLSTPTTPYYVGDIWIETDATTGGNRVCTTERLTGAYVAGDWTKEGVTSRMDSAELRITPTAITSTVRSSTEYTNDLGAKENTVFKQNTAPTHVNGRLWLDTSVTPNILYRSNGTAWVKATPTQASEVGAFSTAQGSALTTRVDEAEQKITPTAITSTVRSSTEYTNDLGAKENTVFKQNTAPTHVNGRLWLDTSVTPNILYRSNGTAWVKATPTQASEVGAYSSGQVDTLLTNYSTITQTATDITLAVSTSIGGQDSILPYNIYVWQSGFYENSNGLPFNSTARLRTQTFFNILSSTDYLFQKSPNINAYVLFYTSADVFISAIGLVGSAETKFTTPSNATRCRAWMTKTDSSTFVLSEMPNHWVRVVPVGQYLKGSKFEINGEKIISQADGIEFRNSGGTPVVFFDTVNNRFVFIGQVEATTGLIGRFAISGQDLVYTSELFEKDYDRSDVIKLQRILLGFEPQTAYDLAVYDFDNTGTLDIFDLFTLDSFVSSGTPLPTPRKRIRSVVRIGTNNGALTTQAVAENGSAGPTTTIRGEKVSSDLINANLIGAKGSNISQMSADGLSFSGVGSTNSRTLDDYEEGTFTPVLSGLTTAGVGTYSVQEGRYTKVGNKVTFGIRLIWSAHTGTGGMIVSLPFTSAPGTFNPCTIVASNLTFTGQLSSMIGGNENRVVIYQFASNTALTVVNMDTNATLHINGTYMV